MSISNSNELQRKLDTFIKSNPVIEVLAYYDLNGIVQTFYSKRKIDSGEKHRYAATTLASTALASRALNSLSMDQVQFVLLKGEKRSAGIGICEKYYILVITEKITDAKKITIEMLDILK